MVILLAVILALALLYFWLIGHWFARVVMFLLCVGYGLLLGEIVGGVIAGAIGWFASGIPVYVRQRKITASLAGSGKGSV
jgi:hypothetical protein